MARVKVLLYTSKKLKNGEHPIMLRVIKDRKVKYVSLGHSCSKDMWDFEENLSVKSHPNEKRINLIIRDKLNQAERFILQFEDENRDYSLEELIKKIQGKKVNITIIKFHEILINNFKLSNQLGNAQVYNDSKNSLLKFNNNKDFYFSDVTYSFLKRYEKYFRERSARETSISCYMRTLRAVINRAIKEGYCRKEYYPFNEYKISKLNTSTAKRALNKELIQKLAQLKLENKNHIHSRNYFLFSYYNMGINFTDLARLKWSNIYDDRMQYRRIKTGKLYSIKLLAPAIEILEYYKENFFQGSGGYIFPILSIEHKTEISIRNRIHKVLGQVNKNLKELPGTQNFNIKLTTYVARHSWATILKNKGVSTAIISAGLGHGSEKTTQVYLDSFENDVLDEANKNLL